MAVSGLSYSTIEEAVRQAFVVAFQDRLSEERCQIGDVDTVFDRIMAGSVDEGVTDGIVLEFGGGTSQPRRTFGNIKWAWVISCVYMIRYHDGIEADLREVVSRLPTSLQEDPRLSSVTPKAYVTDIGDAAIGQLNDISFYLIPFYVEALDRSIAL